MEYKFVGGVGKYSRGNMLDMMFESDFYSMVMGDSIFWCEICEMVGYDILMCINVFFD